MALHAFAVDLFDDPQSWHAYDDWHKKVWLPIMRNFKAAGVRSQRIWRLRNRLFMFIELDDGVDFDELFARYEKATPEQSEWDVIMRKLQCPLPGSPPETWWQPMGEVYSLDEALAAAVTRDDKA
jgi:L-rhamnose mutarotase